MSFVKLHAKTYISEQLYEATVTVPSLSPLLLPQSGLTFQDHIPSITLPTKRAMSQET